MSKLAKALTAAAGNAGESLYVEDVFSTYLYDGNGATQTITNGIDLDGEGGLVWIKNRDGIGKEHFLVDSERGIGSYLASDSAQQAVTYNTSYGVTGLDSTGFSLGPAYGGNVNSSGVNYASWTFRKAEKFFDVVTYTGDGSVSRDIPHSLNSVPACIIVKRTSSTENWTVYHQELNGGTTPYNWSLRLNSTNAEAENGDDRWVQPPTSTDFTVGDQSEVNTSGQTYVAYLFASDAGGFGDDGSESIIKCGSYAGNSSTDGPEIDLGFEPQFLLVKAVDKAEYWVMADTMRGITGSTTDPWTAPNVSDAEFDDKYFEVKATGFKPVTIDARLNGTGYNYIYIAIRRPMKTPESGTEVFDANETTQDSTPIQTGLNTTDVNWQKKTNGTTYWFAQSRLTGNVKYLRTNDSTQELDYSSADPRGVFDTMGKARAYTSNPNVIYSFKRATGFFDVVAYTGDGVAGRTVAHNLGVAPELMIFKNRSQNGDNWVVYSDVFSPANYLKLNSDSYAVADSSNLRFNNTAPTDTVFTVGTSIETNFNGQTYISYHFATLAGVSKVGSYTGTGSNVDVDCGFSAGARFILIKRSDSGGTGDWYVWDSERGIVAGNDPYLLLNSTAAEVTSTDYIDPLSSGFTVTSSAPAALNASGGTYIFLAIA